MNDHSVYQVDALYFSFSALVVHLDYFQFVALRGQNEVVIFAQISLSTSLMISLA